MKNRPYQLLFCPAILIGLELLPFGVITYFAIGPNETIKQTFSYFSLTPLGYAYAGPFLTAALTCILLFLSIAGALYKKRMLMKAISLISMIAMITSITPIIFGIKYISIIGIGITILLLAEFLLAIKMKNHMNHC